MVLSVLTPANYLGPVKRDWPTSMSLSPPDAPRCGLPCGGSADRCLAFSNTVIGMQTSRPSALLFLILAGPASYSAPSERSRAESRGRGCVCHSTSEPPPATRDASSVKPMRGEEEATKTSDDDLGHGHTPLHTQTLDSFLGGSLAREHQLTRHLMDLAPPITLTADRQCSSRLYSIERTLEPQERSLRAVRARAGGRRGRGA